MRASRSDASSACTRAVGQGQGWRPGHRWPRPPRSPLATQSLHPPECPEHGPEASAPGLLRLCCTTLAALAGHGACCPHTCSASRSSPRVASFQTSAAWQWSRCAAAQKASQLPFRPPAGRGRRRRAQAGERGTRGVGGLAGCRRSQGCQVAASGRGGHAAAANRVGSPRQAWQVTRTDRQARPPSPPQPQPT